MAESIESYEDFCEELQDVFDEWCAGESDLFDEMRKDDLDDEQKASIQQRVNSELHSLVRRANPKLTEKVPEPSGAQLADWVKRIIDAKGVPLTDNLSIRPDNIEGRWGIRVMFRW